ncbi:hypothetical protein J8I87_39800 [Paraburkholderia sp. LEh10]|uniref:hypothetical protein n=1 Tax=Paraburkholderia sp. LEh10 TaxID=2821353 RepID=UPI001AE4063B|nr:hypothetical protein [Paraburkholderia sp. LEh10]MBP0595679.1 hypothetical protein [Paraburkholderia sp. LEh10]
MSTAHIAFAKDVTGKIAAASAFFVSQRSEYFCVACKKPLQRISGSVFPYFIHASGVRCRLSAHHAMRAAAQSVLEDARFMRVPAPSSPRVDKQEVTGLPRARLTGILLFWGFSASDVKVASVPVDFLASDSQFGQVAIRLVVPGLTSVDTKSGKMPPDVPMLQVSLPAPGEVRGFADLRQALLHDINNKAWLIAPSARASDRGDSRVVASPGPQDVDESKPWHRAVSFTNSAVYRQLAATQKLQVLERLMQLPCDRWPPEVDIEVKNGEVFGVDRRIWEADVLARFILHATPRTASSDFTAPEVLGWVESRYDVTPAFPGATLVATKAYLSELVARGILGYRDARRDLYVVLRKHTDFEESLVWSTHANLSASQLRVLATRRGCRFRWTWYKCCSTHSTTVTPSAP